jgi:phosphopantetheinyl transferase
MKNVTYTECIYLFDIRQVHDSDDVSTVSSSAILTNLVSLGASVTDIERIQKYHVREDRLRTAVGELILRKNLQSDGPIVINRADPVTGNPVKPYVVSPHLGQFNISHDSDLVAVAIVRPSVCVGIDVMKVQIPNGRSQYEFLSLMRDVFTEKEWTYIAPNGGIESLRRFYRLWTAKEAYLKCIGTGLYVEPRAIEVILLDQTESILRYEASISGIPDDNIRLLIFEDVFVDYIVAVCISSTWNRHPHLVGRRSGTCKTDQLTILREFIFHHVHLESI